MKRTLKETIEFYTKNDTILFSMVDNGHWQLALNLWETSYKKFHITNYLFMCITKKSFEILTKHGLNAYFHNETSNGLELSENASFFQSNQYKKKSVQNIIFGEMILKLG